MTCADRKHGAFTLVEIIVVVVILGVIAGLVGPRMVRRDSRQAEQTVRRVGSLLESASRRAAMSSDAVLVEFDDEAGEIRVLSREREEGFRQSWDERVRWRVDPLIPAVALRELEVGEVSVDNRRIREAGWRIRIGGSDAPASVSIELTSESPQRSWRVLLDGGSGLAVSGTADELAVMAAVFVDLDDGGKRDAPW